MKYIKLLIFAIFANSANADSVYPYLSLALGYKLDEAEYSEIRFDNKAIVKKQTFLGPRDTAIIEAGFETNYNISFGLKHDSHLSAGEPFNSKDEYHKTEIFIRYKIGGRP